MKRILLIIGLIVCLIAIPGCFTEPEEDLNGPGPGPDPEEILAAEFTIVSWFHSWVSNTNIMTIYYQVENTGNVRIEGFNVQFAITQEDGNVSIMGSSGGMVFVDHKYTTSAQKYLGYGKIPLVISAEVISWTINGIQFTKLK